MWSLIDDSEGPEPRWIPAGRLGVISDSWYMGLCHNPGKSDGEPKERHGKTIEEETTEHATAVQQVRAPFHGHGVVRFDRDP